MTATSAWSYSSRISKKTMASANVPAVAATYPGVESSHVSAVKA